MAAPKWAHAGPTYRTYRHPTTGEEWPSVTSILNAIGKPHLAKWAAKQAAEEAVENMAEWLPLYQDNPAGAIEHIKESAWRTSGKAAKLGTRVHAAVESIALGQPQPDDYPKDLVPYLRQFAAFQDACRPEYLATEATVINRKHSYAGTMDGIVRLDHPDYPELRGTFCVDWKTGKSVYPEAALQLAAYRHGESILLANGSEVELPETDGALVVVIRPRYFEVIPVRSDADTFRRFLYVRQTFLWQQEGHEYLSPGIRPKARQEVAQ